MAMVLAETMLPAWVVLPLAVPVLIVLAMHVVSQHRPDVPARRRRLRTAAGLLMMFVTVMLASALCVDNVPAQPALRPQEARSSLLLWLMIIALVGVCVILAALDMLHTLALGVVARRKMRDAMIARVTAEATSRAKAAETGAVVGGETRGGGSNGAGNHGAGGAQPGRGR